METLSDYVDLQEVLIEYQVFFPGFWTVMKNFRLEVYNLKL